MSDDLDLGVTRARITTTRATPAELLALARERAPDPAVFDETTPFFWPAEISSTRLDSYFGHMAEDTLRNFAADAAGGVAFLEAHRWWTTPFGASLSGAYLPAELAAPARVLAEFFTLPGLVIDGGQGRTSDDFIRRVSAGIQRDVSVGFHVGPRADGSRGRYVCDLCGGNLLDWRACPHIPGLEYELTDPTGVTRARLATFTVFNASLSEVSGVYDGATPGATIRKAREAAVDGQLSDRQVALLEARYRCALPPRRIVSAGVSHLPLPTTAVTSGRAADHPQEPSMEFLAQLRQALRLSDAADEAAILAHVRAHPPGEILELVELDGSMLSSELRVLFALPDDVDPADHVRALAAELPQLRRQADDGQAYRDDVVAAALAEAVRALGAEAEERYRPVLAGLELDAIRAMTSDWAAVARQRLSGGRRSVDKVPPEPPSRPDPAEPPAAVYRAG